ncbi:MAG: UDP-glucose 4-epimerase GalE [Aquiluna sp.]|nr:UDP-glucose 4-epimerase GalE [Aquiluna sp.]
MKLLITGGLGYIGSHVVLQAQRAGHEVVVVDDLSTGLTSRVDCQVVDVDLASEKALDVLHNLMNEHHFEAVIHLAARKQVGQSVEQPERYFKDNIGGLANLLLAMKEAGIKKLVFSSSAATYGIPEVELVPEDYPGIPINPYGQTKLIGEWMVSNASIWGLKGLNLRYFNVAGCEIPALADTAELNLIPIAIAAIKRGQSPKVFGVDYPTIDGSCVRDYVHVGDLANAHLLAVAYLEQSRQEHATFNVGTGIGASVLEVLAEIRVASGLDFELDMHPRRPGDPPKLIADTSRIENILSFKARHDLKEIVKSAWDASS